MITGQTHNPCIVQKETSEQNKGLSNDIKCKMEAEICIENVIPNSNPIHHGAYLF